MSAVRKEHCHGIDTAYAIARDVDTPFDETVERMTEALAAEGFGVLTTIDVPAKPDLGVLLPCNVVVRHEGDHSHVAAMEPLAALRLAGNPELEPLAAEARERIERAVSSL